MIRRLLLVAVLACCCNAQTLVQSANGHTFTPTATATFGAGTSAGCLIVATVFSTTNVAGTASDNTGNTYHVAVDYWDTSTTTRITLLYAYNCAAGTTTITASVTGAANMTLFISEWSGVLATSDPLDNAAATSAYSPTPTVTLTDGTSSDLVYGFCYNSGTVVTGAGFTVVQNTGSFGDEYKPGAASGSVAVTFALSGGSAGFWNEAAASFKPAAGAAKSAVHPHSISF